MIAVQQGAIPDKPTRGRPRKYPLDQMDVGQFFDVDESESGNRYQVLHACIRYYLERECPGGQCQEFQIDRMAKGKRIFLRVTRVK